MAKAGNTIENPIIGDRVIFRRTGQETGGEVLEFDLFINPNAAGPPVHVHPHSDERFTVRKGSVQARIDGQEFRFSEGESFTVPEGVPHTWWNDGQAPAHVLVEFRPASRMDTFLETIYGLCQDGKVNAKGIPRLLQLAVTAPAYFDVNHLEKPPLVVQKIFFGVLRPIARMLGYQADYPYPYRENAQGVETTVRRAAA